MASDLDCADGLVLPPRWKQALAATAVKTKSDAQLESVRRVGRINSRLNNQQRRARRRQGDR